MACPRPCLLDLDPHRILIAVDPHLNDALTVSGTLSLAPKTLARAAVIPRLAGDDGPAQRLGVHMGDHQQIAGTGVGHNAGDEPLGIEFGLEHATFLDALRRVGWTGDDGIRQVLLARSARLSAL